MMQHVYTTFISINRASFHLWWKENLVKHQKVSNYCENDCWPIVRSPSTSFDQIKSVGLSESCPRLTVFNCFTSRYSLSEKICQYLFKVMQISISSLGDFCLGLFKHFFQQNLI